MKSGAKPYMEGLRQNNEKSCRAYSLVHVTCESRVTPSLRTAVGKEAFGAMRMTSLDLS